MSQYWCNKVKILKYARYNYHNKGGKKKAAKYYGVNIEVLREDARNMYRNF